MRKTYVWFCGPSGSGKTWLSEKCRTDLALCQKLRLGVSRVDDIHAVADVADQTAIEALTRLDSPCVFIHWQTQYDLNDYGVQRLRQADPDASHFVLEIHRAERERLEALRQKKFMQGRTDEQVYAAFFAWAENDYSVMQKHAGIVTDYVRVFLADGKVYRMEPIG